MLGEKPKILTLDDVGTRYNHYQELRELFSEGIEVVKQTMTHQPNNDRSKKRMESLQHAFNEIDHRIEVLAGYADYAHRWSKFGRELDSIEPHKTDLLEGSNVPEVKQEQDRPLPPCPKRDSEDRQEPYDYTC